MHRDDEEFTDYSKIVPTYSNFSSFSNVKLVIYFPGFLDTYSTVGFSLKAIAHSYKYLGQQLQQLCNGYLQHD